MASFIAIFLLSIFLIWLLTAVIDLMLKGNDGQEPAETVFKCGVIRQTRFDLILRLILPLNHLLLIAVAIITFWESRELDHHGFAILGVLFYALYTVLQWIFWVRLKSISQRRLMLSGIFQVGLLMLFLSQVLLISLECVCKLS